MRRGVALALLAISLLHAEDGLQIREHDALLRPGILLRFVAGRAPGPAEPGERLLSATLQQDGHAIAHDQWRLATAHQLDAGAVLHLPVPHRLGEGPVTLHLRLEGGPGDALQAVAEVPTWPDLLRELATVSEAVAAIEEPAPRVLLLLEQAQRSARRPPSLGRSDGIRRALGALRAVLAGDPLPAWPLAALRCPVDGSIQPLRITRPERPAVGVVHVLAGPNGAVAKDAWPPLPAEWLAAADEQGLVVVEWYPAGDRHWTGIARTRVALALESELARHGLEDLPQAVLGLRGGATGMLHLAAARPARFVALAAVDPSRPPQSPETLPPDVAAWFDTRRSLRGAAGALGQRPLRAVGRLPPAWESLVRHLGDGASRGDEASLWAWLGASLRLPPDEGAVTLRRWPVLLPGRYGPIEVVALERWGATGELSLVRNDETASLVSGSNVAAWRWLGEDAAEPAVGGDLPPPGGPVPENDRRLCGTATSPIDAYATGPFTVVVGRSGHLAAIEADRALGQAFLDDWTAHAHGAPPWAWGDAVDPEDLTGRHLVCIGDPASNRLLHRMLADTAAPVRWDGHRLRVDGHRYRTGPELAVALCLPRSDDPTRLLVVLDGAPGWERAEARLPLGDLPDLNVVPQPGYHDLGDRAEPIRRFLDRSWR